MANKITLVLKGYPRLSETFIAQEIRELERSGLDITLVSLRHPTDVKRHPVHDEIKAPIIYLPEYLYQEPWRVFKGLFSQLFGLPFWKAAWVWCKDLVRDPTSNRVRRFGQSLVLARELPQGSDMLYAHFIHTPGSVTRYTSILSGLPWSASAHAKDIWTTPEWELKEKLVSVNWLTTCTSANTEYLKSLCNDPDKVFLSYHGLDFNRFSHIPPSSKQGKQSSPVSILSVGRAVPKKGYSDLLEALAGLDENLDWKFIHIGGGPLLTDLKEQADLLGISQKIEWRGAQSQAEVLDAYRGAEIFVLASRVNEDGDRDGLPNVLMEAQSQRLACLSTNISGIPELIHNEETGLLVPQKNIPALGGALYRLVTDPELRNTLAEGGYQRVRSEFSLDQGIALLLARFEAAR